MTLREQIDFVRREKEQMESALTYMGMSKISREAMGARADMLCEIQESLSRLEGLDK